MNKYLVRLIGLLVSMSVITFVAVKLAFMQRGYFAVGSEYALPIIWYIWYMWRWKVAETEEE